MAANYVKKLHVTFMNIKSTTTKANLTENEIHFFKQERPLQFDRGETPEVFSGLQTTSAFFLSIPK